MEMYTTRRADKLIAVSIENKKDIVQQYDISPDKIEVVPNGITPERFTPSDCESKTVVYVGRLHERKRVDKLVDAFAKVRSEVPDARLKIVGTGNMEEKLRAQIKRLNLEKSVKLTGFVPEEELPKNYSSGSVFVLPSAYEGFGIVLIEAMASGLPVVSVKTGGAVEVVKDDWNGYLVDYETMSDAIIKLLNDKKLRKKMGRRGRKFVEENYSWRKIARDIIKVYESVM
jgi:glycosyltransferase involved in cell wall biosynthesis